jgi:hypothetical protein
MADDVLRTRRYAEGLLNSSAPLRVLCGLSSASISEAVLQRKLNDSRGGCRLDRATEAGAVERSNRYPEVSAVERVENFGAEKDILILSETEALV